MLLLQVFVVSLVLSGITSLHCNYLSNRLSSYSCRLSIDNGDGKDDFYHVAGKHSPNKTNEDVIVLLRDSGTSRNIPSIICSTFSSLELIDFHQSNFETISAEALKKCKNLTVLNLSNNLIRELPIKVFERNVNLKELKLSSNQLSMLPERIFKFLRQLKVLSLRNNSFVDLPSTLFRSLTILKKLDLSSCEVEVIRPKWFETLENIEILSHNSITRVPRNTFTSLKRLKSLNLGANKIEYFDSLAIANNTQLSSLSLNRNNMKKLPKIYFPSSLTTLDIGSNYFEDIHTESFKLLTNLQALDMSSCKIRELKSKWFSDLKSLRRLELSGNEIEELPSGIFKDLRNLKYLNLDRNYLRSIDGTSFGALDNLLQLYVRNNRIESIDKIFISKARSLFFAWFSGNSCIDKNFNNFVKNSMINLEEFQSCFNNFERLFFV